LDRSGAPGIAPAVVALRGTALFDISAHAPTMSDLLESADALQLARRASRWGRRLPCCGTRCTAAPLAACAGPVSFSD
jgi:fumarylacetoacetate (FAA) hydrolase family protein